MNLSSVYNSYSLARVLSEHTTPCVKPKKLFLANVTKVKVTFDSLFYMIYYPRLSKYIVSSCQTLRILICTWNIIHMFKLFYSTPYSPLKELEVDWNQTPVRPKQRNIKTMLSCQFVIISLETKLLLHYNTVQNKNLRYVIIQLNYVKWFTACSLTVWYNMY